METIKIELTAELEVEELTDEEYDQFVTTGDLPAYVWDEIRRSFLSNIVAGYGFIGEDQNYINI